MSETREKVDLIGEIVAVLLDEALKTNTFHPDTRTQLLLLGAALAQTGSTYSDPDEEFADDEEDRTGKRPAAITREEAEARYATRYDVDDDEDEDELDEDERD